MSTRTTPSRSTPKSVAWRARCAAYALAISVLIGMQPVLTQVPLMRRVRSSRPSFPRRRGAAPRAARPARRRSRWRHSAGLSVSLSPFGALRKGYGRLGSDILSLNTAWEETAPMLTSGKTKSAEGCGSRKSATADTGGAGVLISANVNGGQCARIQRVRHGVGVFSARPRPQPGLSLGGKRDRRLWRRPAAVVPGSGAVERPRPDPQRAVVRVDQFRGQSRRGRQGALLLPRRHADAFVYADALQVSASGFPIRLPGRRKTAGADGQIPNSS
jgi:hypothetical protein